MLKSPLVPHIEHRPFRQLGGSPAWLPLAPRAPLPALIGARRRSSSCPTYSLRVNLTSMDINTLTPYVGDALCVLALHYGSHIALRVSNVLD